MLLVSTMKSHRSVLLSFFFFFLNSMFTWGKKNHKTSATCTLLENCRLFQWTHCRTSWKSCQSGSACHRTACSPPEATRCCLLPDCCPNTHWWDTGPCPGIATLEMVLSVWTAFLVVWWAYRMCVCVTQSLTTLCYVKTWSCYCLPHTLLDIAIPEPGMSDPITNHNTPGWKVQQLIDKRMRYPCLGGRPLPQRGRVHGWEP